MWKAEIRDSRTNRRNYERLSTGELFRFLNGA